jgi:hypothetical protein
MEKGTVLALFLGGRCNSEKYCSNSVQERKKKKIVSPSGTEREPWIAHISPLIRPQEIKEYVALRELVGHTKLQENMEDSIRWCWTTDGEYTAKSAYLIQFQGTFSKLKLMPIWKAKAEPKCGFFAWMLLHKKILTANNLIKRNWPNDLICKLCGTDPEMPTHLCKDCVLTKQVWSLLR